MMHVINPHQVVVGDETDIMLKDEAVVKRPVKIHQEKQQTSRGKAIKYYTNPVFIEIRHVGKQEDGGENQEAELFADLQPADVGIIGVNHADKVNEPGGCEDEISPFEPHLTFVEPAFLVENDFQGSYCQQSHFTALRHVPMKRYRKRQKKHDKVLQLLKRPQILEHFHNAKIDIQIYVFFYLVTHF